MKRAQVITLDMMKFLKARMTHLGLTQARLAKEMKVSLPTLKRWFAGQGLSLEQFLDLVQALGLTLEECVSAVPKHARKVTEYTRAQEQLFVRLPSCLAFFDLLLKGITPKQIAKDADLSSTSLIKHLNQLEKVGLIERLPQDKIKILIEGEVRWPKDGLLAKAFRKQAVSEFLDHVFDNGSAMSFGLHNVSAEDALEAHKLAEQLRAFLIQAHNRARLSKAATKAFGGLVAFGEFQWNLLSKVEEI